jgi:hypothetical protein
MKSAAPGSHKPLRGRAELTLPAVDDRATLVASVPRSGLFCRFDFIEVIPFTTAAIEAFWTKALPQLLAGDGQMAVAATHGLLPLR